MIKFFIKWILLAVVIFLLPQVIPDIVVASFTIALIASAVMALINVLIRPIMQIISFPINMVTLGLFSVVINALLFWLGSILVPGFDVTTIMGVVFGSVLTSIARWLVDELV